MTTTKDIDEIVITVRGGCLTAVYSSCDLNVELLDFDTDNIDERDRIEARLEEIEKALSCIW